MMNIYKTDIDNNLKEIFEFEKNCWINLISPKEKEIDAITNLINIDKNYLMQFLDEEEQARIDIEDDVKLIVLDVPTYERMDDKVKVVVNHVMDDDHYIEWICLEGNDTEITVKLKPGQKAEVMFPYINSATLYAYCNKHGLWENKI